MQSEHLERLQAVAKATLGMIAKAVRTDPEFMTVVDAMTIMAYEYVVENSGGDLETELNKFVARAVRATEIDKEERQN